MNDDRPFCLRLGEWEGLFYATTQSASFTLSEFRGFLNETCFIASRAINSCQHLVVGSPPIRPKEICPVWLPESEHRAWVKFYGLWRNTYDRAIRAGTSDRPRGSKPQKTFTFSWPRTAFLDATLAAAGNRDHRTQFFAVVVEDSEHPWQMRLLGLSLYLATAWHVAHQGLFLHSGAVSRSQQGFLFLGDSGAGKTSIARLSASIGCPALGDDLNFEIRDEQQGYKLAAAPSPRLSILGYSDVRPPLRAVFTLVRDKEESLIPLSPLLTARALLQAFLQTPSGRRLPDEGVSRAFRTACDIARHVPGYELHFRKTPGFWKLIDERFPA